MEGIRFVTDDDGRKVAVQIVLEKHGELWEDFYDTLVVHERAHEEREPWETLEKRLTCVGKLRA